MRIVITGLGVISPLGNNPQSLWEALLTKQCAAREWSDLKAQGFRIPVACRVADFEAPDHERGQQMAVTAAKQAVNAAKLSLIGKVGVYVGSTMGESYAFESAAEGESLIREKAIIAAYPNAVQRALQLSGPIRAYGTACAAGNYAIGAAAQALKMGIVDAAIAGGVESFSRIALVGFSRSRAMTPDYCRPFDHRRRGMQLGEATAFVVLEQEQAAYDRGAIPIATVESLGLSCDAFHPTAPRPDGSGMATSMSNALKQGNIEPQEIDWICAHGTGTVRSDSAEAKAIETVFPHNPPVSSIKGALGHSLGAATAVEAVVTALALQHKVLPPTVNFEEPDPQIKLDIVHTSRSVQSIRWALNCGYAFGGLNSALLMGSPC